MTADDFTPRYVGDTSNGLVITFTDHESRIYDISNVNTSSGFTMTLIPEDGTSPITGVGSWSFVTNGKDGMAEYSWASADVANPGFFAVRAAVHLASGWLNFDTKEIEFRDPNLPE